MSAMVMVMDFFTEDVRVITNAGDDAQSKAFTLSKAMALPVKICKGGTGCNPRERDPS
jgi:molybdopterin biosynthesis enzyme MoaB